MAGRRTGWRSCKIGVEPHDANRADEEARDISTFSANVIAKICDGELPGGELKITVNVSFRKD